MKEQAKGEEKTMTYADAINRGYANGRIAWQRGYVSRKINADNQTVHTSGSGELYVLLPTWQSSQYCIRQYLVPPTADGGGKKGASKQ